MVKHDDGKNLSSFKQWEYFNLQGKDISTRYQKAVKWWIDSDFPKKSIVFKAFSE